MSVSAGIRRNCYWIKDIITNKGLIYKQYKEIKNNIDNPEFAFKKMQDLKAHAIKNTEFYKNYKVDDAFPIRNKMDYVQTNYEPYLAKGDYDEPIHVSKTSGSTGTPFAASQNYSKRCRNIADLKAVGELCDYKSHEKMVFFRVYAKHRSKKQEFFENIYYRDSRKLDDDSIMKMCEVILNKKPNTVFTYPSTFSAINAFLNAHSEIDMKTAGVKSLLIAGEGIDKNLTFELEKKFGCPLYRRYSDMELGILGQDDGKYGKYRLNWASYYFECLKLDRDEPTEDGEIGRIVITDLFNYCMPIIRYDTGDLGIMDRKSSVPTYTEISGRKVDSVFTQDKKLVAPQNISVSMWGINNIKQWKFVQKTLDYSYIEINKTGDIDEKLVINKLKGILGQDVNIEIKYVDDIPVLSSNKRKYVVSELWK